MAMERIIIVRISTIMGSGRIMRSKGMDFFRLEGDRIMVSGSETKHQEEAI